MRFPSCCPQARSTAAQLAAITVSNGVNTGRKLLSKTEGLLFEMSAPTL